MELALERGAALVKRIDTSPAVARECIEFLLSRQTSDELQAGTSLHRNGLGLNKEDAQLIDSQGIPTDVEAVTCMAIRYSTQLAEAIESGELVLRERREAREHAKGAGGCDAEEEDEVEDTSHQITVTPQAVFFQGTPFIINRGFCEFVMRNAPRLAHGGTDESAETFVDRLMSVLDEQISWMGMNASSDCVDGALYMMLPPVALTSELVNEYVRIYWSTERRWVTGQVTNMRHVGSPCVAVDLRFPSEGTVGSLTGSDVFFMYKVPRGRKKRTLVSVEDEDDDGGATESARASSPKRLRRMT